MSARTAFRYLSKAVLWSALLYVTAGLSGYAAAQEKKTIKKEGEVTKQAAAKEKEPEPVPSLFEIYVNAMKEQTARTAAQPTTTADEQVAVKEYFGIAKFLTASDDAKTSLMNKKIPHMERISENGSGPTPYSEHIDAVTSLAISRNGKYILSGSMDHMARLWEKDVNWEKNNKRTTVRIFQEDSNHKQGVTSVAFTPDEKYVITSSLDQTIRLWQISTGKNTKTFRGLKDRIWSVAVAPNGRYIAGACNDGIIMCWSLSNVKKLGTLEGHAGPVFDIDFSPNGSYLASAGADQIIRIWNMNSATEVTACSGHTDKVYSAIWDQTGSYILSASRDKTARIWNPETGDELCRFVGHVGAVRKAIFMPVPAAKKEQGVGTGNALGAQMANGPEGKTQNGLAGNIPFLVVTSSDDGTVRIWIPNIDTKSLKTKKGAAANDAAGNSGWDSPAGGGDMMMGGGDMMMGGADGSAMGPTGKKKKKGGAVRPVGKSKGIEICKYSLFDLSGQTIHTPVSGLNMIPTSPNQFAVAYMDGLVRFWDIPDTILLTEDQKTALEKKKKALEKKAGK